MRITLLLACRDRSVAQAWGAKFAPDHRLFTVETVDFASVERQIARTLPDVLLLQYSGPDERLLWRILERVGRLGETARTLMLCEACSPRLTTEFILHGVSGCVPADAEPSLWTKAVLAVHRGESWFGRTALLQALRCRIASQPALDASGASEDELLTGRERQILALIGDALTNKEIARRLNISDTTVKTHLHHIYVKLHQSGRYKAFIANPALRTAVLGGAGGPAPVTTAPSPLPRALRSRGAAQQGRYAVD